MSVNRGVLLSILDKLGVEYVEKIPQSRAQVKLERAIEKNGIPEGLDAKQAKALVELGISEPAKASGKPKKSKKLAKTPKVPAGTLAFLTNLFAIDKSEKAIRKIMTRKFNEAGVKDQDFIERYIGVGRALAESAKEGSVVKKNKKGSKKAETKDEEKPAKKGKKLKKPSKKEKPAKPAKKGKKKSKKSSDEEE